MRLKKYSEADILLEMLQYRFRHFQLTADTLLVFGILVHDTFRIQRFV